MHSCRRLTIGLALAALLVAFAPGGVAAAAVSSGSVPSAGNTCVNPVLATNAQGWVKVSGGSASRRAVADHVVAKFAYRIAATTTVPQIRLPQQAVVAGQQWTFAVDSRITGAASTVRLGVDWFNAAGKKIAHVDGPATATSSTVYTRVPMPVVVPAGATRANVLATAQLAAGSQCSAPHATSARRPLPHPRRPRPATTVSRPPPSSAGVRSSTVTSSAAPPWTPRSGVCTTARATPATACAGRRRSPRPAATSPSPACRTAPPAGWQCRWAASSGAGSRGMQVPLGDARYHPVLILWPDAEDFPVGGEVDYAETTAAATNIDFFLHFSASNSQTQASKAVDLTAWHNYAVEWTPAHVRGYVDGVQYFEDTNLAHLPPRAMHQTIQLDWFPSGTTTTRQSSMNVGAHLQLTRTA